VVLVGIGGSSRLFGHALTLQDWQAIAGALSDLAPARVIWAMKFTETVSKDDLPLGPNVLVVPWVDYNDVLGHPATRLFISHCGVHSMYEAAFHGVPVLALPFTPDQGECSVRFTQKGLGLAVPESVAFRTPKNHLVFQRDKLVDMAQQVGADTGQFRWSSVVASCMWFTLGQCVHSASCPNRPSLSNPPLHDQRGVLCWWRLGGLFKTHGCMSITITPG
jgi:hypothetical protein